MKLRSSKFNRLCLGALGCSLWALNSFLCGLAAAPAERNWPVYLGDRGSKIGRAHV